MNVSAALVLVLSLFFGMCMAGTVVTETYPRQSTSTVMTITRRFNGRLIKCAAACIRDQQGFRECAGFQFNKSSCFLFRKDKEPKYHRNMTNEIYMPSRFVGQEKQFGQECTSSDRCVYGKGFCLGGKCTCVIGFSYNFTIRQCVRNCAQYGEYYDTYERYGVAGCNIIALYGDSLDGCSQRCKNEKSFVCVNADYKPADRECLLCDTPWFDLHPSKREDPSMSVSAGWILTYRHCSVN